MGAVHFALPPPVTHPVPSQSSQFGVDFRESDPNKASDVFSPCLRVSVMKLLLYRSRRSRAMTAILTIPSLCLTSSADSTKLWFNVHRSTRKSHWRSNNAKCWRAVTFSFREATLWLEHQGQRAASRAEPAATGARIPTTRRIYAYKGAYRPVKEPLLVKVGMGEITIRRLYT
jgi:hypothetical protein